MRGLYVHIPFCLKKCHYCNFVITIDRTKGTIQRFMQALEVEALHFSEKYNAHQFDSLYLGGGTPSALSASEMEQLMNFIHKTFEVAPEAEVTCEVNPGDVDVDKLKLYRDLGINRISLGVQSFDESLLKDMGRPHGVKEILSTVSSLKELEFNNISIDLICRLPHQTLQDFLKTVDAGMNLEPHQVTLYDLEVHPKTVFGVQDKRGTLTLCDPEVHYEMVKQAEMKFSDRGYEAYALGCYAKPGYESRHNLIYWHNQEYLGLGPGAFSYLGGVRYQFAGSVRAYFDKCKNSDWSCEEEDVLTAEEKTIESLTTGFRLKEGIDDALLKRTPKWLEERVHELIQEELMARDGSRVQLTQRGKFLFDDAMSFLLQKEPGSIALPTHNS